MNLIKDFCFLFLADVFLSNIGLLPIVALLGVPFIFVYTIYSFISLKSKKSYINALLSIIFIGGCYFIFPSILKLGIFLQLPGILSMLIFNSIFFSRKHNEYSNFSL